MDKIEDIDVAAKFLSIKNSAESRGIKFTLTLAKVRRELKRKKCFYTGVELTNKAGEYNKRSFERIDNSKGYTDDNVYAVCQGINKSKGAMSVDEIFQIYTTMEKLGIKPEN